MKKTLIAAAVSISMLAGLVTPAFADNRDHGRQDWHQDTARQDYRRDDRHDDRNDEHDNRRDDRRDYRSGYNEGRRDQYRHDVPRYAYSAPRYVAPRGYYVQTWHRGDRLPRQYWESRYVVNDYNRYQLYAPPRGHHWVRVNNDVLLTAVATGAVVAVVSGLFH
jgi:Ni/Co efflux regulator RcnB